MNSTWLGLVVIAAACGGEGQALSGSGSANGNSSTSATAQRKSTAVTSVATSAAPVATLSASATTNPIEPAAPPGLASLFDGPGSEAVPIATTQKIGRASVGLPKGWRTGGGWDSVDHFTREDKSAGVVVLRLDISEGLLDANLATWVKVPFAAAPVTWAPREDGKLGRGHLVAKVATGTGKIGPDDASFWHVASAVVEKKYGLVVIAGLKNSAEPQAKEELLAVMRSIEWQ